MGRRFGTGARIDAPRKRKILKIKMRLANLRVGQVELIPPMRTESKKVGSRKKDKLGKQKLRESQGRPGAKDDSEARSTGGVPSAAPGTDKSDKARSRGYFKRFYARKA